MKGALLVNLGSPDSTSVRDVRKYLDEFLMDKRVIDVPYLLRTFIVRGIILNTRPKRSAAAYRKIWWEEGSPLIVLSERLLKKVEHQANVPVALAMRYGKPSIESGIKELAEKGVNEILLIPLYPQFAMATTETILVKGQEIVRKKFPNLQLAELPPFYERDDYIQVLGASIKENLERTKPEHLLFSYHGVPERHIKKSDITGSHCTIDGVCCQTPSPAHAYCYRHQCFRTTEKVVEMLGLEPSQYSQSFQSRLGRDPWLQPYTDKTIHDLAKSKSSLAVVTPAFVADCLETLEEIGMEGKQDFLDAGGTDFHTIPCLNDSDPWAELLSNWINQWASTR
jgi:ferrochelatase